MEDPNPCPRCGWPYEQSYCYHYGVCPSCQKDAKEHAKAKAPPSLNSQEKSQESHKELDVKELNSPLTRESESVVQHAEEASSPVPASPPGRKPEEGRANSAPARLPQRAQSNYLDEARAQVLALAKMEREGCCS